MEPRKVQKLVDVFTEIVMRMQNGDAHFDDNKTCAEWVRHQLQQCGFSSREVGCKWVVLDCEHQRTG